MGLVAARNWKELARDPELTHISQQFEETLKKGAAMRTQRKIESRRKIAGLTEALEDLRSICPPGKANDPDTEAMCNDLDASLAKEREKLDALEAHLSILSCRDR